MTTRSAPLNQCKKYLHALREYRWLWIVPTVALTLLAGTYATLRQAKWKAAQAFVVRDEATGGHSHQGRFDSTESMKTFQETILEVARNESAVAAALTTMGPPADHVGKKWPTASAIDSMQDAITISAPRGGEFGKTEVIHLSVIGNSKQQALQRTEAVYHELEQGLAQLRNAKASSLAVETADKLSLAKSALNEATSRLEVMERQVGSDLGELRILNDSGAGDSNLRASLNQLKQELRQARAAAEANEQQERMLIAANQDPENLLATSSRLFDAQPSLRQLNEGMLAAQLRSAELQGKMTDDHPLVKAALDTEHQLRRDFYIELAAALRGVQSDLEVNRSQVETLQQQHDATGERLNELASLRARYANLVDEVRQRNELVENAQQELAASRASQSAAESASLITRFDTPVVGSSPIGPSRSMILAAGLLGGLMSGFGLVFLAMPAENGQGRRISDFLGYGRRAADRQGGRRAADATATAANGTPTRRAADAMPANQRASDRQVAERATDTATVEPPVPASAAPSDAKLPAAEVSQLQTTPLHTTTQQVAETPRSPEPVASHATNEQIGNPGRPGSKRRSLLASCLTELTETAR
jgi:uncharacterized protein involved in exopolysaccharide biosynthesis